ncbi:TRAP transporter small permease [Cytobacillus oceanisediminis]|uniref:TRAP-type C4-dicarboxylate transport system permease small subunit n=1 Tax=Cytobacillus oceanisediminis TaxID=665099 RepID=A0A562J3N7_9BACI|nr:TRAP transporter small permease [Cytobacillus oceanisediminis]TWH77826.1 TRAP-type C4-dicarboxylate transport system permease small subunit [Cytobacillus oceanisediminis]
MNKVKYALDKALIAISSFLLIAMVVLSTWQVLARYVFNISSPGTEEITRFMLIWFGLMAAAYVFGAKKHIGILFFREKFEIKTQLLLERITDIIILVTVAALMVFGGINIVMLTSAQTAAATGISMGLVYAALPVSGVCIILYTIHSMVSHKSREKEEVIL